jgi:hypothetical protein
MKIRTLKLLALLVVGGATAVWAQTEPARGPAQMQPCSGLSSLKVPLAPEHVDPASGKLISQDHLPMRVDIGRYTNLRAAVEGYTRTGVLLTSIDHGRLSAAGYEDDVAIFALVSAAARWLHLELNGAIYLLFLSLIGLSLLSGTCGVFALTRSRMERAFGVLILFAIVVIGYRFGGDIYMFPALVPVALVPWAIYFATQGSDRGLLVYAIGAGLLLGCFRFLRIDSIIPTLALVVLLTAFGLGRRRQTKVLSLLALAIAFLAPGFLVSRLIHSRDAYLQTEVPGYSAALGRHPIWHNIYIGMGFLSNPYAAGYCDQVAIDAVEAAAPGTAYMSPAYESVLKSKILEWLKLHPAFVLFSVFSKTAVAFLMLLVAANLGLIAAVRHPKPRIIEVAFWSAMALSAIPGILAVPVPKYMTGLLAFAIMYSSCSIAFARGSLFSGVSDDSEPAAELLLKRKKEQRELTAA